MRNLAESLIIEMMGSKLLLEPALERDLRRGIEYALAEETPDHAIPLERLTTALQSLGLPETTGVINLLNVPLGPLWVRAALHKERRRLAGHPNATLWIVGLWSALTPKGKRTARSMERFRYWQNFIESQLAAKHGGLLNVVWVG